MKKASIPPKDKMSVGALWYLKEIDEAPVINPEIPIAATAYTQDGRMLCHLSPKWDEWSDEMKVEVLSHEAGHVSGGHDVRMGKRDGMLWNIVCDAAIHYSKGVQEWAVEALNGVTYDKLGLPPVPPEVAYDMLKDDQKNPQGGCGREGHGNADGFEKMSGKAKTRALVAAIKGAHEIGGGLGGRDGIGERSLPEVIPSYPPWMYEILERLKKVVAYDDPQRRWIKETRRDVDPILLPGRAARQGIACLFIWDLSGSISQEDVARFLGAVEATPELANSEVVAFSDIAVGPRPIQEVKKLVEECPSGGTQFHSGAAKRVSGIPVVWITDGYTGDGWPEPHDTDEFWIMSTDVVAPHGVTIRA